MELKQYVQFARRWWHLLALFGVVGVIVGYALSAKPPMYGATTTLMMGSSRPTRGTPNTDALKANAAMAMTYTALVTTRPVMEEVVNELQLNMSPGTLASRIEVRYLDDTDLILLTAQDPDRNRAAEIANTTVEAFNRQASALLSNPYVLSIDALRVVETAQPGKLMPSDTLRNVLVTTLLGLLLAIGIGALYDYFDDRVKTEAAVAELVNLPTLAHIPHIRGGNAAESLVTTREPGSPIAEAFRKMRGQIAPASRGDVRSVVITSANRVEGKSTVAANLAVAMAQTGLRVVLVDADLRRPSLHDFFGRSNQRGLTTALARQRGDSLATHLVTTDVERLQLLPSGPLPSNPTEVLGTPRFAELIADLENQADLVIVDSPALLAVVDPVLLVQASDAAVVVTKAGTTRAGALKQAITQLDQAGARTLGVVLNQSALPSEARNGYNDGGKGLRALGIRPQPQPRIAGVESAEIAERPLAGE